MSDLKLPQDKDKKPEVSFSRMAIWIVVGRTHSSTGASDLFG